MSREPWPAVRGRCPCAPDAVPSRRRRCGYDRLHEPRLPTSGCASTADRRATAADIVASVQREIASGALAAGQPAPAGARAREAARAVEEHRAGRVRRAGRARARRGARARGRVRARARSAVRRAGADRAAAAAGVRAAAAVAAGLRRRRTRSRCRRCSSIPSCCRPSGSPSARARCCASGCRRSTTPRATGRCARRSRSACPRAGSTSRPTRS